ncbi:MAG: DNA polymerase III subunit delta [Clostridia bacterium]|nr:DNA polymerase III subunit delta [Clostridia bacterium]
MKVKEFIKADIKPYAVFEIFGEDRHLCLLALEKIKNTFAGNLPDINVLHKSFAGVQMKDLLDELKVCPLGDLFRVVVLEDLKTKKGSKQDMQAIENYAESQEYSSILVLFNAGETSLKINGAFEVDCAKLDKNDLTSMIIKRVENAGGKISNLSASKLCDYCSCDLARINGELDKLISFCGKNEIKDGDIEEMVAKTIDYQIFELTDKIARGDKNGATEVLFSLIKTEKSLYTILGILYNTYRRALFVSINKDKTDGELASAFGVKEYAVKMLRVQARAFTPRKLKIIVDNLASLDAKIKQGKIKDEIGLEIVFFEILNMI